MIEKRNWKDVEARENIHKVDVSVLVIKAPKPKSKAIVL